MAKKYRPLFLFIVILFFVGVACKVPILSDKLSKIGQATKTDQDEAEITPKNPLSGVLPQPTPTEVNSKPVGIQEGLGSLDSYTVTIYVLSENSDGSKTEINETIDRDVAASKSHSVTHSVSRQKDDTEDSTSDQEIYSSGLVTCTKNDETWDYSEMTDQEKEMADVFKQMVDFVPLIDNPSFVGEEEVNGVQTNHFTFEVSGIGKNSGSVATTNQGDYWLAIDGQYIVKYQLKLEVHSASSGSTEDEVSSIVGNYDLTNINQPLDIALPTGCAPSVQ